MLHPIPPFVPGRRAQCNLAADLGVVCIAVFAATREGVAPTAWRTGGTYLAALGLWLLGSRVLRRYDFREPHGALNDLVLTSLLVLGASVTLVLASYALAPPVAFNLPRFVAVAWPATVVAQGLARGPSRTIRPPEEVLIAGTDPLGRHTALDVATDPRRRVIGFLAFRGAEPDLRLPGEILGGIGDIEQLLRQRAIDEVYVAGNVLRHAEEMQAVVQACERFGVPFALPASSFRFARARPSSSALADGYVHYLPFAPKPAQLLFKRAFDIAASTAALVVLFPLLLGVAVAIKVDSRGPILFRQERCGRFGHPFRMLKFRSMAADAEAAKEKLLACNEQTGPVFKMARDPRITRVGRFIRKYSIDELPQLVNVLRGDMTLVGPRPPLPTEVAKYEPWQRRRLSVRPGLTCIWQVSGRNSIQFERWMYLDMQYIDHWSVLLDLRLIARTFAVVLSGRGAS